MTNEELKQRLTELLYVDTACDKDGHGNCLNCEYNFSDSECAKYFAGVIAEFLLKNGVTIREHGEWIGLDGDTCSKCGHNLSEIMDADSYYAVGFDIREIIACPFCGADMRDEKDKQTEFYM